MSRVDVATLIMLLQEQGRHAGELARLHAALFDAPWDTESFTQLLAHPSAIAFVACAGATHARKPLKLQASGPSELTPSAHPNVPSPPCRRHVFDMTRGGTGWGDCRTSEVGVPPTPNPSPHFGGAPSARRGGESGCGRGQLCGFIVARLVADEAEILTLGVARDRQRLGIGRRLVEALAGAARQRGARRLYLEVAAGNIAAHTLYDRLDFHESGRRAGYYARAGAPPEDAINLCLALE